MRIRGIHIIFAGILGVSLFVFFAISRASTVDGRVDVGDPGFYDSVAESPAPMGSAGQGLVPGIDDDPEKSPPKIVFPTNEVDLGELSNKEKSVREFMITNAGERPLVIKQVQTTCACTMAFFSESREPVSGPLLTIPPGQVRPMYIEIDPYRINGWEATKTLTIWSNDPSQPQIMLDVTSHIKPEFELSETKYDFGSVERGLTHKATILLRQVTDEPFDVQGVRPTGNAVMPALPGMSVAAGDKMIPTFDLRLIKRAQEQWQSPDKAEWVIEIALSPSLPEGAFNGYYEIQTSVDRLDSLHCSFAAQITSFFRVVPEVVTNRRLVQGQTEVGSANIVSEKPFTVSDVEIEGPWFSAVAVPSDDSKSATINVTVDPEAPTGPKSAAVRLNIVAEDGRTFEHKLGVRVNVRSPAN